MVSDKSYERLKREREKKDKKRKLWIFKSFISSAVYIIEQETHVLFSISSIIINNVVVVATNSYFILLSSEYLNWINFIFNLKKI